ncbi:anti-sigma factor family protein [Microbacterium karelineae]|uniref:anti-sigma factor family protein n=1 Tax=Microbacterium karelineae TaxID=2654283 RepID=UPI0012E9A6E3|nr:zf-HC2 domain-containing protein [Microbacterium karelineae]
MSHDQLADWDAAYVLGSLSPADRARFEEHLDECAACRASVADLAPVPGLLSRVPRERAEALLAGDADDVPADRSYPNAEPAGDHASRPSHAGGPEAPGERSADARARIVDLANERVRRRRRLVWAVSSAAAVIGIAAVIAIPLLTSEDPPGDVLALETVVDVPISASVDVTGVPWGTRIDMTCTYDQVADAPTDGWGYALVVVATDGSESELSTWRAYAGSTAELSAGTELAADEIASIEVRSTASGAVLLRGDPADLGTG